MQNEEKPGSSSSLTKFQYFSDGKGSRIIEVAGDNQCHLFDGGHAEWFTVTRAGQIMALNPIQFQVLIKKCHLDKSQRTLVGWEEEDDGGNDDKNSQVETSENDLNQKLIVKMWNESGGKLGAHQSFLFNDSDVSIFMDEVPGSRNESDNSPPPPLIFPGTKWCGRGDIASSDADLGLYEETDKCCRSHDKCPENISAGQARFGLQNNGSYTRSHCECDLIFLRCLERDRSLSAFSSFKIANLYFNILRPECFAKRHPPTTCREKRLSGDCITYEYDFQQPTKYQFFAAQPYVLRRARKLINTVLFGNNYDWLRPLPTSLPVPSPGLVVNHLASVFNKTTPIFPPSSSGAEENLI